MTRARRSRRARAQRRCTCGKAIYRDKLALQMAAARTGFRIYFDRVCGRWHLTSAPPRGA
jgi:hypothetical protein